MTDSIVLYVEASWCSPWVCLVWTTLREKQIPFTTATGMLRLRSGAIELLRERTLTGTAPVLQHGTFWLAESLAIVEYLEEMFPQPRVLPAEIHDRARARQVMAWMRHDHALLREERPSERIFYPATVAPLSPAAREMADQVIAVAEKLGADARGRVFETFGVFDVELAFALMRLIATGHAVPERLRDYAAAVWARPSVREFVEHQRPPNPPL